MSQENMEIVLGMFEGLNSRIAATSAHVSGYREAWDTMNIVIEDIHPVDDRVVACIRYGGVGSQSGADVARPMSASTGAVFDFRAARILRARQFVDYAGALQAVGLEQDAPADS